jgi:hypothetical protein
MFRQILRQRGLLKSLVVLGSDWGLFCDPTALPSYWCLCGASLQCMICIDMDVLTLCISSAYAKLQVYFKCWVVNK